MKQKLEQVIKDYLVKEGWNVKEVEFSNRIDDLMPNKFIFTGILHIKANRNGITD